VRLCLVTPFDWSQPHDVNEHVAGIAGELRRLGHDVTILAPSSRPRDLLESRRALDAGAEREVVAIGPAVPVSRRSRLGMPLGSRTTLGLALENGRFDVVHGFEPGMPSLSYLALRDGKALAVASFLSARRLGYPPGKAQRERLLGRLDALIAGSERVAVAAGVRFPGEYTVLPVGVDLDLFQPAEKERLIVVEWAPPERQLARAAIRTLR
jgi:phosphatidylinositol alpha-mannosyltransferase